MAIKREDLISSVLNKVRQTFNDDKGFFRQGKFTPVQEISNRINYQKQVSPINRAIYTGIETASQPVVKSLANIGALGANVLGNIQMARNKPESALNLYNKALAARQYSGTTGSFDQGTKSGLNTLKTGGLSALQTALTGKGLKYTTPTNLAVGGLIGGTASKLSGGDFATGFGQGAGNTPQIMGFVGATNPLLNKLIPQTASNIGGRIAGAGLNVAQGIGMDVARGTPTTLGSVALDVATGLAGGKGQFETPKIKIKGMTDQVFTQDKNIVNEARQILKFNTDTPDQLDKLRDTMKVLAKKYELTSQPNWNKFTLEKQYEILSNQMDEMAKNWANVSMGIVGKSQLEPKIEGIKKLEKIVSQIENEWFSDYPNKGKIETLTDEAKTLADNLGVNYKDVVTDIAGTNPRYIKGSFQGTEPKIEVPTTKKISPENLSTQAKTLSDMPPIKIKQPVKINIQSGQVLEPNKLDSSSESIIQQARQQIGEPIEPKKSFSQKYDEFYTNWVDRYNPIVKLTEGVKNIDPSKDPKYIIRRFLGAGGIAEQRFNTEMKPILKQIDDLGIDKTDLDTYLINKRNVGFGEIGRQVKGSDPIQSQKVVSALEAKYGDSIKGITDSIYEFQNKGLDEMVNAGFISPESAKSMRGQNPNYAPFQRVMDEMNDYLGLPTKKAMVGTQPIQKLKGSEKQILSPVESIISNIFSQRAAIEKNNVAKSVAGLQDVIPDLGFKKVSKGGDSTITVWNNGKKEFIEVGSDIARSMKGMNEESANSFMKILTAPASLLRQGATGRNPEFMLPNIIRDQLDAATNSKYGYVPFVDYIRGLYHVARKDITGADEVFDSWMKSGGSQSFGSITGRKSISEMFDKTKAKKGLFSWLGSGLDVAGKYSEVPTRLGLYGKALKKGATPLEAAYESREGTMDFARMGAKMKVANSIIPFLNVQVQGFDKMIRNFKNTPAKTTLKMGLYGVAPAVMATLYNEMYHPSEYAEIPQYVKDDNFVLVKGRNEKGTVDYVTIPKGNLIRLATNPTESFISYLAGNDKTTFGEMATQFLSSNLPLLGEGQNIKEVAIKTIGQNIPQAIKPITENLMNKSFYKYDTKKEQSKEIVPYYLQNKPPAEQTYKFTPAMYQTIGKIVNVSPLKVQNLMEGYLAGYTKIPANIIDSLKNISEGKDVEQNKVPILRRFIQETYPTSTTVAKPTTERTSLIPQVQASEGGFLDKIFPSRLKTQETTTDIKYTNKNGNEATIKLSKVTSMPEQTAYQRALKEKQKYTLVDDILDNLDGAQQIEALQALGISSEDATYYNTAKQENYLKSIYVEEEIMDMIKQGQNKDQILNNLVSMRKAVNEKILLSDGVINDLVDKNIISYTDGKALKNIDKDLTPKKTGTKVKKAKKISLSSKKFTASKKKYNPLKVKSTTTKSRFTPPKYVKADLRTPTKLL